MPDLTVALTVPLALGVPSLVLLVIIFLARRRPTSTTEYSPVEPASKAAAVGPAPAKWAMLLVSIGIGVTAFYTLAIQVGLSHPESEPLDAELLGSTALVKIHRPQIEAMRLQLGLLTGNASLLLAWAIANATWIRTLLPPPSELPSRPIQLPGLEVPPSLSSSVLPNNTINETLSRIEGDQQLWQLLSSVNEANQTASIETINGNALNLSNWMFRFQNDTRAYNVYDRNSSVVARSYSQTSATASTSNSNRNTLGPVVVYGASSFGKSFLSYPVGFDPPRHNVRIDDRSRVYFHNLTTAYVFRQLGRPASVANLYPGFWVASFVNYLDIEYSTEIPWYPQGLFHAFFQLTDGLDYQRPGEPSIINNPSVFQMDTQGNKTTYFMGPVIIDPLLTTPTLQVDVIHAVNVTVLNTLYYQAVDTSDARVKFDFANLKRGYFMASVRPVSFEWISSGTPATGFLAQEVASSLPPCEYGLGIDVTCLVAYQMASMQAVSDWNLNMKSNVERWDKATTERHAALSEGLRVRLIDKLGYESVMARIN